MKPDITCRADIEKIVREFYDKVRKDELIGFFFSDVVPVNWETHLPVMCSFWENVLFYTGEYEGNPIDAHRKIHLQYPTNAAHFQRWLQLFYEIIDASFSGPNADKMKGHSLAIANVMQQKITG